jgi:hypothetical protein
MKIKYVQLYQLRCIDQLDGGMHGVVCEIIADEETALESKYSTTTTTKPFIPKQVGVGQLGPLDWLEANEIEVTSLITT